MRNTVLILAAALAVTPALAQPLPAPASYPPVTGTATVNGLTKTDTSPVTVTTAFVAKINFQPAASPVPAGWQVDAGLIYGARGNGLTYGWSVNVADTLRDRNLLTRRRHRAAHDRPGA